MWYCGSTPSRRGFPPPPHESSTGSSCIISPVARLEVALLHEIARITDDPEGIIGSLGRDIGLGIEYAGWSRAAEVGAHLSWTRDRFDRLITAHALAYSADLCTRDRTIRDHYSHAVWIE